MTHSDVWCLLINILKYVLHAVNHKVTYKSYMGKIVPVCTLLKAPRGVEVYLHSQPHQWLGVSSHLHALVALAWGNSHPPPYAYWIWGSWASEPIWMVWIIEKLLSLDESQPTIPQSLSSWHSQCADWVIQALFLIYGIICDHICHIELLCTPDPDPFRI
jgi:hypothetical protein